MLNGVVQFWQRKYPLSTSRVPRRLLFVDDDIATHKVFSRLLHRTDIAVDSVHEAMEALRHAEKIHYPVVVSDLRMPGMDGLSLIRRIQSLHPSTAFVIVTGVPEIDLQRDHDLDPSIASVVAKPWEPDELIAAIERAFQLYQRRALTAAEPLDMRKELRAPILLVEDNPPDADLVCELLIEVGSNPDCIDHVVRLDDALIRLQEHNYILIITDLSLPDGRGLDAVARLHATAPELPIVVLSGMDHKELSLQALQMGAQDYLVKGNIDASSLHRSLHYSIERKSAEQRLSHLARYDQLTGLANRISFRDRAAQMLTKARKERRQFGVMFLDLDRFKSVNDTLGHEAGDLLLQEVAARLASVLGPEDVAARLGGDEFGLLVVDVDEIVDLGHRILESVLRPITIKEETFVLSTSIGVAIFPEGGETVEQLVSSADTAMYQAKRNGRSTMQVFTQAHRESALRDTRLERELEQALDNEQFLFHFQPQYDLHTRRIRGVEALLRWRRNADDVVPPSDFVPVLERTGLIHAVGRWGLGHACKQLRQWLDLGIQDLRIAVNMSATQFDQGDIVDFLRDTLHTYRLRPQALELEVTESTLMRDTHRTNDVLSQLKRLGVRIAIDDFGTGYSSLAYLNRFSVDVLKIDRSFTRGLTSQARSKQQIATAIIALGHNLGLEVVAEGIETAEQLIQLRDVQCDVGQGFLLGRPQDAQAIERLFFKTARKRGLEAIRDLD